MRTHLLRHIGVALASTLGLSSLALTPIGDTVTAQAAPANVTINPLDKDSVQNAYFNVYLPNVDVATGWTGDTTTWTSGGACDAGSTSQEARDATVNMINYYRALAGLKPVTENAASTDRAQQAALIQAINAPPGPPNHYPPEEWTCYSTTAYTSSGASNLAWGQPTGGRSIVSYMADTTTATVGHRAAILYPPLGQVGVGIAGPSYPIGYALEWMTSDLWTNQRPSTGTAVAWPSKGFFPFQNLPNTATRYWSYSLANANFGSGSDTQVTVTLEKQDGTTTTIHVTDVTSHNNGSYAIPDPVLVWTMPALAAPSADEVDTYHVHISGRVTDDYDVKVFNAVQKVNVTSVTIGGATAEKTAAVGTTLTAIPSGITPSDATPSYAWYRGTTQVGTDSKTYTVTPDDAGQVLSVKVTGSKPDWVTSDPVTSSTSVTIDSLSRLTGTVTSNDGTVVGGTVIAYDNVTCSGAHDDITTPDHSGTVTAGTDGKFWFDTIPGQCYRISVVHPTNDIVIVAGQADAGWAHAGASGVPVIINQVTLDGVTIPGTVTVGQSISGGLDSYQPADAKFSYQWYRDGVAIPGASDRTYTVSGDDYNRQLTLRVQATFGTGQIERISNTATVGPGSSITFTPRITGTAVVGQTLTTLPASLPDGWTPSYQWLSGGVKISGATASSYTLVPQDANTNVSVHVTLTRSGYDTVDATSDSVHVKAVYSVTFDALNGTDQIVKTTADGGTVSLPPTPEKAGSTFGGWLKPDGKTVFTAATAVTSNITVTASWAPIPTYSVTYDPNQGTGTTVDSRFYHTGDSVTILDSGFTREGYTFTGWNTAANETGTQYAAGSTITMGTADMVLFAQWNQNSKPPVTTYSVSYNANGGTGGMTDSTPYPSGSKAQIKAIGFTREGYTFTGWKDAAGTSYAPGSSITMTANVTLFAQWQKNGVLPGAQFTLSFDANEGAGAMAAVQYPVGALVTAPENGFSREGYTFVGWNTAKDGTGLGYSVAASFEVYSDMTLYAQWVANAPIETPAQPGDETPAQPGSKVPSGGSTSNSSMLILLELGLLVAGVAVLRLRKTI